MLVSDGKGGYKHVSDFYRDVVRKDGLAGLEAQINVDKAPVEVVEEISKKPGQIKQSQVGSILGASSPYGQQDETDLTHDERKRLRELPKENPLAYTYIKDIPREAIYSPDPLNIVSKEWQKSEQGVENVTEWQHLFEARRGQASLMNIGIWAAEYYRQWGEVLGEIRFLKHPYLHLLGYPNDMMIGRIDLINPGLLTDVQYDEKTGDLKYLEMADRHGNTKKFKGKELKHFFYFHNNPSNEKRGMSRLLSTMRWLEGFDDLLELTLDMHYNDARPIEHHKLDETGLTWQERENMKAEHITTIENAAKKGSRALVTSKRVEIELLGMGGRVIDSGPIIDKTKGYNHQALRLPESFVESENANKATIDVQEKHYQVSQLNAIDRSCMKRLFEEFIFPLVLKSRGVNPLLTPIIKFPPFTSSNALETAMVYQIEGEVFGEARIKQIAEENGYDYSVVKPAEKSKNTTEAIVQALLDKDK